MTRTDRDAGGRPVALADRLFRAGDISDPAWRDAFARVPRHVFVPSYGRYEHAVDGTRYVLVSGDDPGQREEWLNGVYSDETLITQVESRPVEDALSGGRGTGAWTSSSTAPGLMARMLEALDVADGMTVLEIGTGTGYNAALLSERLAAHDVTSVDISEQLVDAARRRLRSLGYRPAVAVADGREGHPGRAPYERIIATCAFPHIPPAWLDQLKPGGLVLVNIAGGIGGAMAVARMDEGGTATGRYLPEWAGFMPARSLRSTPEPNYPDAECSRETSLGPDCLDSAAFAFMAQLHVGEAAPYWATHEDGFQLYGLSAPDGSWAEVHLTGEHGLRRAEQGGPRGLWDLIESADQTWRDLGRPDWSGFGITATAAEQWAWFDTPAGPSWRLPSWPGSATRTNAKAR
ncbi:ATP-grasp peptide maturase system methyltransferase [Spirillospora sp. NPDC047418]